MGYSNVCREGLPMAQTMTISDALEAFELNGLYNEIIDALETDFYAQSDIQADLRDLIEEDEELYEFVPDEDGDFGESFERNLKEALELIFEKHGVDTLFDEDFADEALDDDDIEDLYSSDMPEGQIDDLDDEADLSL